MTKKSLNFHYFISFFQNQIRNASWMLGISLLRQVLGLVVTMVLARNLSTNDFGQYQALISLIGICGVFTLSGLNTVITQSIARGFSGTYISAVKISFLCSILGSILILIAGAHQWLSGFKAESYAYVIASLLFPFSQGLMNWQSYQAGKENFRVISLVTGISLIFSYFLITISVQIVSVSIIIPIAINYFFLAIQNVYMYRNIIKNIPNKSKIEPKAIKYGIRTSFYNAFNIVGNYIDKLLIIFLISPEVLAIYAIADRVPELLKNNIQAITQVLIPSFSKRSSYTRSLNRKLNLICLLILSGLIVVSLVIIPWLLPFAFGEKYTQATLYCQLLLLSLAVGTFATTKYTYILSHLDEKAVRNIQIITNVVRISSSIILIYFFGVIGAIISTFLYRLTSVFYVHLYLKKHHIIDALPTTHIPNKNQAKT